VSLDWNSVASLATAGGTLVLAVATFASVRSANRAARAAERSLLSSLRPLLVPSDLDDHPQKIVFIDRKWVMVPGGSGAAEYDEDSGVVYLAASLRNVGPGIGVLQGWRFRPGFDSAAPQPDPAAFTRQGRDIYLPAGGLGFWHGAFRDADDPQAEAARKAVGTRQELTLDLLYSDAEGGQRTITRFSLRPRGDDGWLLAASRHWHLDRPAPR
jgi:hypothetical protein